MRTLATRAHPAPHPLSALALLFADWLATGINIATSMDAYWAVAVGCSAAAAAAIFACESRLVGVSRRAVWLRTVCMAPLVLLPFPFAGSFAAAGLLAWALANWLNARPSA